LLTVYIIHIFTKRICNNFRKYYTS